MIYIYDIVVNLSDGDRVFEFFEWKKSDTIEQLRKIPLLKIKTEVFDDLVEKEIKVSKEFLESIYKKSEVYHNNRVKTIEYAVLFTDSSRVIAIEFDESGKSLFKSYLLLDEEEEILEITDELKEKELNYKIIKSNKRNVFLTREDEFIQKYLLRELKFTYKSNLEEKIKYLYEEVFASDDISVEEKYNKLITGIKNGYERKYKKLYDILRMAHSKK